MVYAPSLVTRLYTANSTRCERLTAQIQFASLCAWANLGYADLPGGPCPPGWSSPGLCPPGRSSPGLCDCSGPRLTLHDPTVKRLMLQAQP